MNIKIKYHNQNCKITKLGDWIDLRAAETVEIEAPKRLAGGTIEFDYKYISLGVSMQLPKYYEANIVPRSSTYGQYHTLQTNHIGIIDNAYCGNNDIWKVKLLGFDKTIIVEGDRICQFRVRLAQNAPIWAKIKWLFTNKINFIEVDNLEREDRGGFGSTNNKK